MSTPPIRRQLPVKSPNRSFHLHIFFPRQVDYAKWGGMMAQ
jgi:hypothetical protein